MPRLRLIFPAVLGDSLRASVEVVCRGGSGGPRPGPKRLGGCPLLRTPALAMTLTTSVEGWGVSSGPRDRLVRGDHRAINRKAPQGRNRIYFGLRPKGGLRAARAGCRPRPVCVAPRLGLPTRSRSLSKIKWLALREPGLAPGAVLRRQPMRDNPPIFLARPGGPLRAAVRCRDAGFGSGVPPTQPAGRGRRAPCGASAQQRARGGKMRARRRGESPRLGSARRVGRLPRRAAAARARQQKEAIQCHIDTRFRR